MAEPISLPSSANRDVVSWPSSALVEGVNIGFGRRSAWRRPAGIATAADRAGLAVFLERRTFKVTADDALDRQHLDLADPHRAAGQLVGILGQAGRIVSRIGRNDMVGE